MALKPVCWKIIGFLFLTSCSTGQENRSVTVPDVEQLVIARPDLPTVQKKDTESTYPIRYYVNEGSISYKYAGIQKGKEDVYFTNFGMTEVKYTETTRQNPFQNRLEEIKMITLMHDSSIYVVDQSTMNAQKLDNTLLYEKAAESTKLDLNEVAIKMYKERGGSYLGIDTILGLPAEHWSIASSEVEEWRWNGIMLKTVVKSPKTYLEIVATAIDTNSIIPLSVFELPKNVNLSEGTSIKEWIEDLSKPIKRRQVFNKQGELVD
jgi:hypothetical protein